MKPQVENSCYVFMGENHSRLPPGALRYVCPLELPESPTYQGLEQDGAVPHPLQQPGMFPARLVKYV